MYRKNMINSELIRIMTWVLLALLKANESVAPVVSTAQLVVPSSRIRQVLARLTSPRYRCTMAVLNSVGVSERIGGPVEIVRPGVWGWDAGSFEVTFIGSTHI